MCQYIHQILINDLSGAVRTQVIHEILSQIGVISFRMGRNVLQITLQEPGRQTIEFICRNLHIHTVKQTVQIQVFHLRQFKIHLIRIQHLCQVNGASAASEHVGHIKFSGASKQGIHIKIENIFKCIFIDREHGIHIKIFVFSGFSKFLSSKYVFLFMCKLFLYNLAAGSIFHHMLCKRRRVGDACIEKQTFGILRRLHNADHLDIFSVRHQLFHIFFIV